MMGKLRVRVLCENCGYIAVNGTVVYMLPDLLECPKCHKHYGHDKTGQSSMRAVVELPNGELAPTDEVILTI